MMCRLLVATVLAVALIIVDALAGASERNPKETDVRAYVLRYTETKELAGFGWVSHPSHPAKLMDFHASPSDFEVARLPEIVIMTNEFSDAGQYLTDMDGPFGITPAGTDSPWERIEYSSSEDLGYGKWEGFAWTPLSDL